VSGCRFRGFYFGTGVEKKMFFEFNLLKLHGR
jgi:hypothetical protein